MGFSYFDIATLPRVYDIVWCRFPLSENPGQPGPKLRPALVRRTMMEKESRRGAVMVSYGTTKLHLVRNRGRDLIIQNYTVRQQLGLPIATRFDLSPSRLNRLPWCGEFFCPPPHSSSIVAGHLPEDFIAQLRVCLKRRGII